MKPPIPTYIGQNMFTGFPVWLLAVFFVILISIILMYKHGKNTL